MADSLLSVWLLLDERASHRSQVLGVAEKLGWPFIIKEIRYNKIAMFANIFLGARLWHVGEETRVGLKAPWPDLVITAGRRCAPVALFIKKHSPATRIVQLMWPDSTPGKFDLIAVPEHDGVRHKGNNLLLTLSAPHAFTPEKYQQEADRFYPSVSKLPRPWIAVLVGGSTRHATYEDADFKMLASYAAAQAERLEGSLLITSSPRTGEVGENLMKSLLHVPHFFHRWSAGGDNPYTAFLGLADAIIVTSDSVSMCSEACSTGKPVYIFTPPHLSSGKKDLREMLFARGSAKPYTYPIRLDWQSVPLPDAAQQVVEAIKTLFART